MNIQEDYCSYELCKLLKEKGFDEECEWYYPKDGGEREQLLLDELNYDYQIGNFIKCPSHALVMKWLREIYHLRIDVDSGPDWEKDGKIWEYCVCNIYEEPTRILTPKDFPGPSFTTYEEAVEAAIKDILVNLILFMNDDNNLITQLTHIPEDKCGKGEWRELTSIPWTDEGWEKAFLEKPHYSDDENIQKKFEFAVKYTGIGRVLSSLCNALLDFQLKAFIEQYFENNQLWTDYKED